MTFAKRNVELELEMVKKFVIPSFGLCWRRKKTPLSLWKLQLLVSLATRIAQNQIAIRQEGSGTK